jgi:hypothetical protein
MQERVLDRTGRGGLSLAAPPAADPAAINVRLHARAVDAVKAREVPADILAPGFYMRGCASSVADYTYRGETGWRDWMNDLFEEFVGKPLYELEQIISTGEDYVVAEYCITGLGARSAKPLTFRWIGVTWYARGAATRAAGYSSRREALEAVGAESVAQEGPPELHGELVGVQPGAAGPHPGHDGPEQRSGSKTVLRFKRDGDQREGARGGREMSRD